MNPARAIPGPTLLPDPPQDHHTSPLTPPTAELLVLLQILLVYARHLRDTLARLAQRSVAHLARGFGSAQAGFVLTALTRGLLRAIALEHVLLAQAGGQPGPPAASKPRTRRPRPAQPNAQQTASQQPAGSHPAPEAADRLPILPTLRQLQAAIRRHPIDSAIDDITRDLGVAFSLCEARFGNALRDAMAAYRGIVCGMSDEFPRQDAPAAAPPDQPTALHVPARKHGAIRYTVGFLRAEPGCAFPFTPASAAAAKAGAQSP
ncbi:MAG TPA: hypothetical protein VFN42_13090 [Acetobacteraceae bacterium]|nr:hypothetical protein [Acetobacteraceae bacterium]